MFEAIVKILPEWVLPVILGLLVWFGVNYLFLAPTIADRTILKTCPRHSTAYCHCVAGSMLGEVRLEITFWTSTLGFYEVMHNPKVSAARINGQKVCSNG